MKVFSSLMTPVHMPHFLGWAVVLAGLLSACKEDRITVTGTVSVRPSLEITLPLPNLGQKYVTKEIFFTVSGTCSNNTQDLEAMVYPADQAFSWSQQIGSVIGFSDADCADGTWSALVDAATLSEGDNTFNIRGFALSTNSNTYPISNSFTIAYDTTAPEFERKKPDIEGDAFYTTSDTETISGTCESGIVSIESTEGTVSDDDCSDGTWSLAPYTFSDEGSTEFLITATDFAGNTKDIETIIYYDISPPSIAYTVPDASPFRTKNLFEVSGTCSDTNGIYAIWAEIIGASFSRTEYFACSESETWAFTLRELTYGNNTVTIKSRDVAGNNISVPVIVDFDNIPPNLAITGYPPTRRTNDSPFVLSGTCSAVDNDTVVNLSTSRGTLVSGTCTDDAVWELEGYDFAAEGDGDYAFTITASDDVENSISKSVTITYDNTPPDVTIDQTPDFRTNIAGPTFSGMCDTVGTVNLMVNSVYSIDCTEGIWTYTSPEQTLEGEYNFSIAASDDLGNTLTKDISWVYDITPPEFDYLAPVATWGSFATKDSEVAVSGTCDDQVLSMELVSAPGSVINLNCTGDGTWATQAPYILTSGSNTILINATDAAGNITENKSISVEYDDVPPDINIVLPSETGIFSTELESIEISGLCGSDVTSLALIEPADPDYEFESGDACPEDGTWILNSAYPLALGENTITVKAYDQVGNARPVTILITRTPLEEGMSLSGHTRYSLVPISGDDELKKPARAIVIAAVDESGTEVDSAITDKMGSFELKVPTGTSVTLVMKAIIPSPFIPGQFLSITDPDGSPALYQATSLVVPAVPMTNINLDVPLAEGAVPGAFAAPFVLLDSIYEKHFASHYVPNSNEVNPDPEIEWIIPSPQSLANNEASFYSVFSDSSLATLGEGTSIPSEASGPWLLHYEVEGTEGLIEKVLEMSLLP